MICFTWSRGHFCFKKHILLNWMKTPDPFLELCKKYYMYHKKDPFQGLKMGILRTFWWENELSKLFGSRDRILPKYGHGRGHFGFFANFFN